MRINQYLDSTYLKTGEQSNISEEASFAKIADLTYEAIYYQFKLIMIRPRYVSFVKTILNEQKSDVLVGTVIGFHEGNYPIANKINEALDAIKAGADELDFVINYEAFLNNQLNLVKEEVIEGTKLALEHAKTIKWIIEVAALTPTQIAKITDFIKRTILDNFTEDAIEHVFIKSSTGFYKTKAGKPAGATVESLQLMLENAGPLKVKAAGGIKSYNDAIKMINLGVARIGTSSAKEIMQGGKSNKKY